MQRLYHATLNSLRGFAAACRSEAAVREEIIALVLAVPAGLWVAPSAAWYVAMIGVLLVLIALELLNTAIEKLADHVAPEQNPKIGALKDYGSAAVGCGLALAALVWSAALAIRLGLI